MSAKTGISQADAEKRVNTAIDNVKDAGPAWPQILLEGYRQLRKFTALAMVIGAFVAMAAAAYGGVTCDKH